MARLRVQEVAKEKGVSMGKLSRSADVSYRTIRLIYKDPYRDVALNTLEKLAKALGVSIADLIGEETEKEE